MDVVEFLVEVPVVFCVVNLKTAVGGDTGAVRGCLMGRLGWVAYYSGWIGVRSVLRTLVEGNMFAVFAMLGILLEGGLQLVVEPNSIAQTPVPFRESAQESTKPSGYLLALPVPTSRTFCRFSPIGAKNSFSPKVTAHKVCCSSRTMLVRKQVNRRSTHLVSPFPAAKSC